MAVSARKIKAKELVTDLRSGMNDTEIMAKHTLTQEQLKHLKGQLVSKGLIEHNERSSNSIDTESIIAEIRKAAESGFYEPQPTQFSDKWLIAIGAAIIGLGMWGFLSYGEGGYVFLTSLIGGPFLIAGLWKTLRSALRSPDMDRLKPELIPHELARGTSKGQIIKGLIKIGWNRTAARQFVFQIDKALQSSPQWKLRTSRRYKKYMIAGGSAFIGGLALTAITFYEAAARDGGTIYVFWHAIAFGALAFLWGLIGWLKNRTSPSFPFNKSPDQKNGPAMNESLHKIKSRDLVEDLGSGLSDAEIMTKHSLSLEQMKQLIEQLVSKGFVPQNELNSREMHVRSENPKKPTEATAPVPTPEQTKRPSAIYKIVAWLNIIGALILGATVLWIVYKSPSIDHVLNLFSYYSVFIGLAILILFLIILVVGRLFKATSLKPFYLSACIFMLVAGGAHVALQIEKKESKSLQKSAPVQDTLVEKRVKQSSSTEDGPQPSAIQDNDIVAREILARVWLDAGYFTPEIHHKFWQIIDRDLKTEYLVQAYLDALTGNLIVYQQLFWSDAAHALTSGKMYKSKERREYEQIAIAERLLNADQVRANDTKIAKIAAGEPVEFRGQYIVLDKQKMAHVLAETKESCSRIEKLLTRPNPVSGYRAVSESRVYEGCKIVFPSTLGGLRRINIWEYATKELGFSVGYGSQQMHKSATANVYVYDLGFKDIPDGPDSEILKKHLETCVSEIWQMYEKGYYDSLEHISHGVKSLGERTKAKKALYRCFRYSYAPREGVESTEPRKSYLLLTGHNKRIVKIRFTFPLENEKEGEEALGIFLSALGKQLN